MHIYIYMGWLVHFSCIRLFETPWTVAHQPLLSTGFSRQEYWSGLPCHSPGDLPNPGIEPTSLMSPALAGRFFTTSATGKCTHLHTHTHTHTHTHIYIYKYTHTCTNIYIYTCVHAQSCLIHCNSMDHSPPGSCVQGFFPGKNTRVCCHFLLQGIFLTQGWNSHILHWQADSLQLCPLGNLHLHTHTHTHTHTGSIYAMSMQK